MVSMLQPKYVAAIKCGLSVFAQEKDEKQEEERKKQILLADQLLALQLQDEDLLVCCS